MILFVAACSGPAVTPAIPQTEIAAVAANIVSYPLTLDPACRDGRAIAHDQCSSQMGLYTAAVDRAKSEGKAVLVIIGAEWYGWCRAFDAHLKGATGRYDHVTKKARRCQPGRSEVRFLRRRRLHRGAHRGRLCSGG